MQWRVAYARDRRRVAVMASREDHCLLDLLWRNHRGELEMDVICVISNHEHVRDDVEALGVSFVHIPVTKETKPQAEAHALELLGGRAELLVLARYMQILSGEFLTRVGCPVINIHHSFLCQRPLGSPRGRPSVLPGGGHVFSPLVAVGSPRLCGFAIST